MVRPGDRVSERYEVLEQLAAGGMGTVWRARHVELDVDVALKVISTESASPSLLKRFKHEAQAAARLRSPNIVQVLDYGIFDDQPYLAMELLRGEDLAGRLARVGRLSPDECLRIMKGIAGGVEVAHEAAIVHRDLKPANIFLEKVGDREVVKVLDFGVAKDLARAADPSGTTGAGAPVGSPAYMSPEQVWGEAVGPATDLWAMGVVAFEMLSGESPFVDETLAKVFERIIRAPLPQIADFMPEAPAELQSFFERVFSRVASERFDSPRQLVDELGLALQGAAPLDAARSQRHKGELPGREVRTVSPFSTTQGRSQVARSQPKWVWGVAAFLLLLGLFGLGWLSLRKDVPGAAIAAAAPSEPPAGVATTFGSEAAVPSPLAPDPGPSSMLVPSRAAPPSDAPKAPRPKSDPAGARRSSAGTPVKVDPQFGIPIHP